MSSRRRPLRTLINLVVLVVLAALVYKGADRTGILTRGSYRAADGNSLRQGDRSIRLHAIDAPELAQDCRDGEGRDYACGREAMNALAALLRGEISCIGLGDDRYGRDVAVCRAGDVELNREMVRLGWAVAYRRHSLAYVPAEQEAKRAKRGLWAGTFEIPKPGANGIHGGDAPRKTGAAPHEPRFRHSP